MCVLTPVHTADRCACVCAVVALTVHYKSNINPQLNCRHRRHRRRHCLPCHHIARGQAGEWERENIVNAKALTRIVRVRVLNKNEWRKLTGWDGFCVNVIECISVKLKWENWIRCALRTYKQPVAVWLIRNQSIAVSMYPEPHARKSDSWKCISHQLI